MPRNLTGAYFGAVAETQRWNNHLLAIEPPSGPTLWLSDTPRHSAPIVKAWGAIPPMLVEGETFPDAQSFEVEFFNTLANLGAGENRITEALAAAAFEGAECRLYGLDLGHSSAPHGGFGLLFRGKLQQIYGVTQLGCRIRIAGQVSFESRVLDHLVRDDWPQAPTEHAARIQPLVFGSVPDFPLVPIDVGVVGTLGAALAEAATTATMAEDVTRFPTAGTIQIGSVEIASYTGKDTTLNTLTGLTRGLYGTIDATHPSGTVVMQQLASYRLLVTDPTFGQAAGVDAVRIAGKLLPANQWSFDTTTCILTISTTAGKRAGRPTMNRATAMVRAKMNEAEGTVRGFATIAPQTPIASRASRTSRTAVVADAPIYEAANLMLCAWAAPASTHFWPCGTNLTSAPGSGRLRSLPTVELEANTPKTWSAGYFSGYLPPSAMLVRESWIVTAALSCFRLVGDGTSGITPNRYMYPEQTNLRAIICRIGTVERIIHLTGDDLIGGSHLTTEVGIASDTSSEYERGKNSPIQNFEFDFGADVDPTLGPFDVVLEAVCDAGGSTRVAYVHALAQGCSGSTPMVIPTGAASAARDSLLPRAGIALTFPQTFQNAILTISYITNADYIKVDVGGGRIVRVTPPQQRTAVSDQGPIDNPGTTDAGYSTFSVLVTSPSSNMTVYARDFGRDGAAPLNRDSDDSTGKIRVAQATLTGVTAGSETYPLLPDVRAESSFLAAFEDYPRADVRGYVGDGLGMPGTGGALLENFADVIEHYLRRVMGIAAADTDTGVGSTFRTVKALYVSYYKCAGAIVDQIDRRIPMVNLARQARAWVQYDAMLGLWVMIYRKSPATIIAAPGVDHVWGPGDWYSPLPELERTADDNIVKRVNVRYMRDWSKPSDLASYQAVASAGSGSPTADERYVCDFVRSSQVADELAALYFAWDGVATRRTLLDMTPANLDAQKGDVVSLTMPIGGSNPTAYLGGINGTKFIVTAQGYTPGSLRDYRISSVPVLLLEVPNP